MFYPKRGRFTGKYDTSSAVTFWDVMRWKLSFSVRKKPSKTSVFPSKRENLHLQEDYVCWLSHASFLLQLGGKRVLIDPVFGNIPFYRRYTPFPYRIDALLPVDYLLVSHTHYDHFDKRTIRALLSRTESIPEAVLPLRMGELLPRGFPQSAIRELDWYECYQKDGLEITLVPARHWSRRGLFDTNRVLWGGYVIRYKEKTVYFAGDTAYGDHFQEIGKRFDIDVALLPIGGYAPEFMMKHNHLNPDEAYRAFVALGAKCMIPMHYGTFKLTDEPIDEPLAWIKRLSREGALGVSILKPGELYRM